MTTADPSDDDVDPSIGNSDFAATLAERALLRLQGKDPDAAAPTPAVSTEVVEPSPDLVEPEPDAVEPVVVAPEPEVGSTPDDARRAEPVVAEPPLAAPLATEPVIAETTAAHHVESPPPGLAPVASPESAIIPGELNVDEAAELGQLDPGGVTTAVADDYLAQTEASPVDQLDSIDDEEPPETSLRWLAEWLAVLVGAVVVALVLRALLFQVFFIPSPSMEPTLERGDRVMVYKLDTTPERGEVMVFERPPHATESEINDLIKRAIGLPGETISNRDGDIFIDGLRLEEPYISGKSGNERTMWTEFCDNEPDDRSSCLIPEGHYFMMGDNRDQSADSRVLGPIDAELFVGRAILQIWPLSDFERL